MRPKVDPEEKIYAFPFSIKKRQIDWINKHPEFRKDKFIRDQIDKYIKFKDQVESI